MRKLEEQRQVAGEGEEEGESGQEQRGQRRKGHRQRLKGRKEWRGKGEEEGGEQEGQERGEEGKTCVQHHYRTVFWRIQRSRYLGVIMYKAGVFF